MTTTNTDPATELAALRERGVDHLSQLRREAEDRRAALARIDAEEGARLQAAEQAFAADLEQKQRQIELDNARTSYTEALDRFNELETQHNTEHANLKEKADAAQQAILATIATANALDEAHADLTAAAQQLTSLGEYSSAGKSVDHGNLTFNDWSDPRTGIAMTARAVIARHGNRADTRHLRIAPLPPRF